MSPASTALRGVGLLLAALLLAGCGTTPAPVEVQVAAINDFHGSLLSTPFSYPDPAADGGVVKMKAGGIGALSGLLAQLRQQDPQLLVIGAGDMIGGSPPISSLWADEPTLAALDLMGLDLSAVGNHELDQGKAELLRQIEGGCASPRPDKACQFDKAYQGTIFPYLSANLMDRKTAKPLFQPYRIERAHGVKIAFVGATLKDVAAYVSARSMDGLYTVDEAQAVNALLPELKQQAVDAIVLVIHQGGKTPEPFDQQYCSQLSGELVDVVKRLDPQIKVVVSGHTHQGYLCRVGDRLVTQGASFGHLLTHLTLKIDPDRHQLLEAQAENLVVDPQRYPPSAAIAALQKQVESRSQAQLNQPLARLGARQVSRQPNAAGESALGDLIADAQLAATRPLGAQLALMNLGGIRADLLLEEGQERVNYGQVAAVQPFNNTLSILTLTGAQLRELLEQQWQGGNRGFYPLQPSASLSYRWDGRRPQGRHVIAESLMIDGQPVKPQQAYRVAVNSFLADGGDNFSVLTQASQRLDTGLNDLEALITYLQARDRAGQPAGRAEAGQRIQKVDESLARSDP